MAKVQVCNVNVLNNPSPFNSPFQFELTFECIEELQEGMNVIFPADISDANRCLRNFD